MLSHHLSKFEIQKYYQNEPKVNGNKTKTKKNKIKNPEIYIFYNIFSRKNPR